MYTKFTFSPTVIGEYQVIDVDYHRNGVGGVGFYTGIFEIRDGEEAGKKFTFVMFPSFSGWVKGKEYEKADEYTFDNATGDYQCAILSLDSLNRGTAEDAWRGDYFYHHVVQEAIKEHDRQYAFHYKKLKEDDNG